VSDATPDTAPTAEGLLEALSLNIWGLPWPLSRQRARRFGRILRHFSGRSYDLVGLQEVWRPNRLTLPDLRLPEARQDAGLALAGRLAGAARLRLRHFRDASGPDRLKAKGVLLAEASGLVAGVTHLQAGRGGARIRARQVDEILALLQGLGAPLVLMGDFNFYRGDPTDAASAARLVDAGLIDCAVAAGATRPTYVHANPFAGARSAGERFDRIYARGGGGWRLRPLRFEVLGRILSDHLLVYARLHLERA